MKGNNMETTIEEQIENTKSWLINMTDDEIEELARWLVENGYGVE